MLDNADCRANRATALCLASISMMARPDTKFDMTRLLALADDYLQYIEGDEFAPIPRPDKARK